MSDNNGCTGFIDYNKDDTKYAGAKSVVEAELDHLKKFRESDKDNLKGLALSGGGIRSASFCLGVIQSLAKNNNLKQVDYLSTVSGGGYLGGSLSWLWLEKWKEDTGCGRRFGAGKDDFPYGTGSRYSNPDQELDREQASLMRHLRQNGKYLTPGNGITMLSLLSVALRSITMGFVTLMVLASLFFHLLYYTCVFDQGVISNTRMMDYGLYGIGVYFLLLLGYGVLALGFIDYPKLAYKGRRLWERGIKYVLIVVAVILAIAIAHELRLYIGSELESAGGMSALLGALIAWYSQKSDKESMLKIIPKPLLVNGGLIVMFMGLLVLSDQLACAAYGNKSLGTTPLFSYETKDALMLHAVAALVIVLFAYLISINKVSIHRYYRDRLMETFMPDVCSVIDNGDTSMALKANEASLHNCVPDNDMPYHIINTNLILVESKITKFRGRGGDNFILSPLFSGSNATGWRASKEFANDSITLPTAVAISGAAANPNTGVAGKGLTLNSLVSALMAIFNLRMGYWTVNPNPEYQSNQKANPNYLNPGFGEVFKNELNERGSFIQLSDGGHFENLAMYELIRRHCKLIICCDAEQDNNFIFESLSNIIEKSRVDFGVQIKMTDADLDKLKYSQTSDGEIKFAEQGYIVADIVYPNDEVPGKLIYIKTTLPANLPADVMGYKSRHPDFPDETTADQFFDEEQFEAYRMLGMHIAESIENDQSINL